jgi:uncharacterized membrane protein
MSNDDLTKHAIRTSADMLELHEKLDDIRRTQADHSARLDRLEERFDAHVARCEDHFRTTDANFLEIRALLGQIIEQMN